MSDAIPVGQPTISALKVISRDVRKSRNHGCRVYRANVTLTALILALGLIQHWTAVNTQQRHRFSDSDSNAAPEVILLSVQSWLDFNFCMPKIAYLRTILRSRVTALWYSRFMLCSTTHFILKQVWTPIAILPWFLPFSVWILIAIFPLFLPRIFD